MSYGNDHDHRGDYANERHDHYDYAEKYHRHYDLENEIAALLERIRALELELTRVQ